MAAQIEVYDAIKGYDSKIQTAHIQFTCFSGMTEVHLSTTDYMWAPKRAFPLFKEFARVRERVQERLRTYCTLQNSLLLKMDAQIVKGAGIGDELAKSRMKDLEKYGQTSRPHLKKK